MTKTPWIAFIGGAAFATAALITCGRSDKSGDGAGGDASAAGGTKWEYATLSNEGDVFRPGDVQPSKVGSCDSLSKASEQQDAHFACVLNALGVEGWELVNSSPEEGVGRTHYRWTGGSELDAEFIFKRPK